MANVNRQLVNFGVAFWPQFLCLTFILVGYAFQVHICILLRYHTPILQKYHYTIGNTNSLAAINQAMWISTSTGYYRYLAGIFTMQHALSSIGLVLCLLASGWLYLFTVYLRLFWQWFIGQNKPFRSSQHYSTVDSHSMPSLQNLKQQKLTKGEVNGSAEIARSRSIVHDSVEPTGTVNPNQPEVADKRVAIINVPYEEIQVKPTSSGARSSQNSRFWLWCFLLVTWVHIAISGLLVVGTTMHMGSLNALSSSLKYPAASSDIVARENQARKFIDALTSGDPTLIPSDEAIVPNPDDSENSKNTKLAEAAAALLDDRTAIANVLDGYLWPSFFILLGMIAVLFALQNWVWYSLGVHSPSRENDGKKLV